MPGARNLRSGARSIRRAPIGAAARRWRAVTACLAAVLTALVCGGLATPQALAATETVTNLNDSGTGSLREALGDAQSGDTIQFASGLSGTIELNSELEFSGDLTIVGNDDVAIDGQHDTVIFLFPSGGVISLSGLTLENGLANDGSVNGPLGGAISTEVGTLKLTDMALVNNTASGATLDNGAAGGAVFALNNLDVSDSSFSGNTVTTPSVPIGGAIDAGSVHVSDSQFFDNSSVGSDGIVDGVFAGGQGGGVYSFTVATITDSTFVDNHAVGDKGAGAAVFTQFLTATNSTFTGNTSGSASDPGGGAVWLDRASSLVSDTVDQNTAGPGTGSTAGVDTFFGHPVHITTSATIVADNTIAGGTSANCSNPIAGGGSDDLEDDTAKSCAFDLPAADPDLAPLADNGALRVETQALDPGSPAIAVIPASGCTVTTDERGLPRPGNDKTMCDVGAYESQGPNTPAITAPSAGATYTPRETVLAAYSCTAGTDGPSLQAGSAGCGGPVASGEPIDTSTTGPHNFTVTATNADGETADDTISYRVAAAPRATIATPARGAVFAVGQSAETGFSCVEGAGGPGIASCVDQDGRGSGARLDTATAGQHKLIVTATSTDGFRGTASVTYTVAARPRASISMPASGAVFAVGQSVKTRFSCVDGTGGPGIVSCVDQGGRASGAQLDTATTGVHELIVTATSTDGQSGIASVSYTVAARPSAIITTPAGGAVYAFGQSVKTGFSCADGAGGPGIASCVDQGGRSSGAQLDTTTAGRHTLTVTATSRDAQSAAASVTYTVLPDNRLHVAAIQARRNGTVSFAVTVPGPGQIDAVVGAPNGKRARAAISSKPAANRFTFGRGRRTARRAGKLRMTVRLNKRGQRFVAHTRHRVTLRLSVSYTPIGGRSRSLVFNGVRLPR